MQIKTIMRYHFPFARMAIIVKKERKRKKEERNLGDCQGRSVGRRG
jgi:hypothetical protein